VSQNEKFFEGFFERYHMKIYLEWLKNTMHRNLWWTLWNKIGFGELDAREVFPLCTNKG
jgi:hypothetical protein